MVINIRYDSAQDAWYFPDLSLYVYRKTIDNIEPSALSFILQLPPDKLESLMPFLRVQPSDVVHNYELTFNEDEISGV